MATKMIENVIGKLVNRDMSTVTLDYLFFLFIYIYIYIYIIVIGCVLVFFDSVTRLHSVGKLN